MSKSVRLPIVAIVGRANVGKSSLFNAILGRRETIVAKEAGTTRDSISARTTYKDKDFWLVDTAGAKSPEDDFELTIQEQISEAIVSADIIWLVIEADSIITDEDRRLAKTALKSKKPVVLVVNKADRAVKAKSSEFQKLGIKPIVLTSAVHKTGLAELLDDLVTQISKVVSGEPENKLRIALLGRPNVGKSSLFNTLAKKQQAVVASKAGTTRDINRANIKYKNRNIELLDTAGIRRSGRIERGVEHFSVLRSLSAIEQANICLLLIDAVESSVQLDQKIAGIIKEAGRGLILVVAKWDTLVPLHTCPKGSEQQSIIPKSSSTSVRVPAGTPRKMSELPGILPSRSTNLCSRCGEVLEETDPKVGDRFIDQIKADYPFVPWAPVIFTSSVTGQNVTKIFGLALEIEARRGQRLTTKDLNHWLQQVIVGHPPAGLKNRQRKLRYMVQEDDPTSFKIFGTQTKFLHWSYKRYLERKFREQFDFSGSPIKFWFIEK